MANIAILSPCMRSFDPAYSISHVIADQAWMLTRHGHMVAVLVSERFEGERLCGGAQVWDCLSDVESDDIDPSRIAGTLISQLVGFHVVITHDWLSHPRMRVYYEALRELLPCSDSWLWLHWINSLPSYRHPWWDFRPFPGNHSIVYPNETDIEDVARQFRVDASRVLCIPHAVDLRTLVKWSPATRKILEATPGLLDAEYVQVYPAAANRLTDKGVDKLIGVFGALKDEGDGHSVCCLVLDSWSGKLPRQDKARFRQLATLARLNPDELVFASDIIPEFRGLPRDEVFLLAMLSNVFTFPTRGEAFGLVLVEAILAGAYPVPNGSCSPLLEVVQGYGYYPKFGSVEMASRNQCTSYEECAREIVERMQKDVAIRGRTAVRRAYNADRIYKDYYESLLERK